MKLPKIDAPATSLAAAARYPLLAGLKKKLTVASRFGDIVHLWREEPGSILAPRQMAKDVLSDDRVDGDDLTYTSTFKARKAEQERVVAESTALLKEGENFLLEAPTGFGKTVCCCEIIHRVGKRTLVVVIKEDLRDQWIEEAQAILGLKRNEIGLIQGDRFETEPDKKVVIAMIHTLSKERMKPEMFDQYGLVIWDEVHRVGADTFAETPWLFNAKLRLGVSATMERSDGKDIVFHAHIGPILVRTEAIPMIPKIIRVRSKWKVPRVRTFDEKLGAWDIRPMFHKPGRIAHVVKRMVNDKGRNAILTDFVKQAYSAGRTIILFSDSKAHLKELRTRLMKDHKIPPTDMAYYIGGLSESAREKAKTKRILLATYQFVSTGTNIPWLDCGILATPRSDVVQIAGRVLREYPDKKQPIIFDLVDMDSWVFAKYAENRREWFRSIGAKVKTMTPY